MRLYDLLNAIPGAIGAALLVGLCVRNMPELGADLPLYALCVAAIMGGAATAILNPRKA